MATTTRLCLAGNEKANELLRTNPLTLLIGMLLDHQALVERAYAAPYELARRLYTELDATAVAAQPIEEIESCFRQPPALHRCPGMMARRVHALCTHLVHHHGGEVTSLWRGAVDAREVYRNVRALPGFTDRTARVLIALLGKQMAVRPAGWQDVAGPYALPGHRSIADVTDRESLYRVRAYSRQHAMMSV
jgi:uncharacterized HhH-GPD family protein